MKRNLLMLYVIIFFVLLFLFVMYQPWVDIQSSELMRSHKYNSVAKLLDFGANPNAMILQSDIKETPIKLATMYFLHHEEYTTARVSIATEAALHGQTRLLEKLVSKGAKINLVSPNGQTPLLAAAEAKQFETVSWLINNGADVNLHSAKWESALSTAISNGDESMVELLIRHKANVNEMACCRSNVLLNYLMFNVIGIKPCNFHIVNLILESGYDIDTKSKHGVPTITEVLRHGEYGVVKMMYQHGANIDIKSSPNQASTRELIFAGDNQPLGILELRKYILQHKPKM